MRQRYFTFFTARLRRFLCKNFCLWIVQTDRIGDFDLRQQRAAGVALAAQAAIDAGQAGDAAALVPNYLRLSQAERERNERLKQES